MRIVLGRNGRLFPCAASASIRGVGRRSSFTASALRVRGRIPDMDYRPRTDGVTQVTCHRRLAHSSRAAAFSRLTPVSSEAFRFRPAPPEPVMHTFYDDIATA